MPVKISKISISEKKTQEMRNAERTDHTHNESLLVVLAMEIRHF